jgi:hypothetical protein
MNSIIFSDLILVIVIHILPFIGVLLGYLYEELDYKFLGLTLIDKVLCILHTDMETLNVLDEFGDEFWREALVDEVNHDLSIGYEEFMEEGTYEEVSLREGG